MLNLFHPMHFSERSPPCHPKKLQPKERSSFGENHSPLPQVFVLPFLQGPWLLCSLKCPTFFSLWTWYIEEVAVTSTFLGSETRNVFVSHFSDRFMEIFYLKKHVFWISNENTHTVLLILTKFENYIWEHIHFLNWRGIFSSRQGLVRSFRDRSCLGTRRFFLVLLGI